MKNLLAVAGLSLLMGACAAKRPLTGVNLIVPVACVTEPIRLKGCDPRTFDHCQKAAVRYIPTCAIVELK